MRFASTFLPTVLITALFLGSGCKPNAAPSGGGSSSATVPTINSNEDSSSPVGYSFPVETGKYTVLGILTDNKFQDRAKANAEDTIIKYPDLKCMVGLWAYNPPSCLLAIRGADKVGQIKVVGFDEDAETLQAIAEGEIYGTIIQQPFAFGYKSVEFLAAIARGQKTNIPESGMLYIDHSVIKADNVEEFNIRVQNMRDGTGEPPANERDDYDTSKPVKLAFLTNSVDPFWVLSQRGVELANKAFNADCEVYMPPNGTVEEQKRFIEDFITKQGQGLAISPIDPENQGQIIDQACEAMPVICQDSDAPNTQRRFYLGTSNYLAGRAAGKLVKEAIPDGGKVMIFVGKLEVLNAQERSRGVIDELLDKPIPEEFAGQAR